MVYVSHKSIQGKRDYMEDNFTFLRHENIIIAMVCDGHGGDFVSKLTCIYLSKILLSTFINLNHLNDHVHIANVLRNQIIKWGDCVKYMSSGSTLTGIVIYNNYVYVYNIGDSRVSAQLKNLSSVYTYDAVLNSISYDITDFFTTRDHDMTNSNEILRIQRQGGHILNERLNGILSVTRALGDKEVGTGLSFEPDIYWFNASHLNGPIILYSDGLYEMARFATQNKKRLFFPHNLYQLGKSNNAHFLVDYAYTQGSSDNITAMIITL